MSNSKKNPLEQLFEDFPQAQYGASLEGSVNTMTGPLHEFRDGYLRAVKDTTFQSALKILRDKYSTGTHPMLEDQLTALVLYTHTFSFFSFRDFLNRELRGVSASASPALKELRVFILCLLGGLRHLPRLRVPCTVYHVLSEKELEQQQQQQQQQQSGNIFSLNYFATTTPEGVPLSYTDCKDNSTQGSSPDVSEEGGVVVVLKVCGYMCAYCIKEFTGRTEFVLNPSLALRMARTEKPYPKNPQLKMMEATATESCVVLDAHVRAYENAARKREALASSSTATAKATPPPEPGPYAEQEEGACLSRTKNTSLEEEYRTVPKTFYESFSSALVTANFGAAQRNGTSYKQCAEEAAADLLEKCSECLAYLKSSSVLERYSMCDEDAMSISLFTLDGSKEAVSPHSVVNELLCKRASIMGIRGYLFYLLNALRKIPPYPESEGPLYRGVCGLTLDSYTVGQKRTWPAFTSTYPEESMAEDRLSGPNQVLFEIHGKYRAYDIRDFSIYHDEG